MALLTCRHNTMEKELFGRPLDFMADAERHLGCISAAFEAMLSHGSRHL